MSSTSVSNNDSVHNDININNNNNSNNNKHLTIVSSSSINNTNGGTSINENTINTTTPTNYNIKERIPTFQLQVLLDLVESISKLTINAHNNNSGKQNNKPFQFLTHHSKQQKTNNLSLVEKRLQSMKSKCPIVSNTSNKLSSTASTPSFTTAATIPNNSNPSLQQQPIENHQMLLNNHHQHLNGNGKLIENTNNNMNVDVGGFDADDLITDFADYNKNHNILLLSEEGQENILAIGYFLILVKGNINYLDKYLYLLNDLMSRLTYCKWKPKAKISADYFSYHLTSLLREISYLNNNVVSIITKSIMSCLSECFTIMKEYESKFIYESENTTRVLYGIFKALSEGLPKLDKSQLKNLIEIINYFLNVTRKEGNEKLKNIKLFKTKILTQMRILVLKIFIRIASATPQQQTSAIQNGTSGSSSNNTVANNSLSSSLLLEEEIYEAFLQMAIRNLDKRLFMINSESQLSLALSESNLSSLVANETTNGNATSEANLPITPPSSNGIISMFGHITKENIENRMSILSNSIELAVICAERVPKYKKETFHLFSELLTICKDEKLCHSLIQGIVNLTKNDNDLIGIGIKTLREFIEESSITKNNEQFLQEVIPLLCKLLKTNYDQYGLNLISSVIFTISNHIYMNVNDLHQNNIRLTLLSSIAKYFDKNEITNLILPVLTGQLTRKKSLLGKLDQSLGFLLRCIANCSHLGNGIFFNEICDLIFGIYSNPFHSSETFLGNLLVEAIEIMNKNLTNLATISNDVDKTKGNELKLILLMKLMKLVNRLGGEIQIMMTDDISVNEKERKDMLKHVAVLLPSVANIISTTKFDKSNTKISNEHIGNFQTLFRTMWFYIIIFGFHNPDDFSIEIVNSCHTIAKCAPVLLNDEILTFMEIKKEMEIIIDTKHILQNDKVNLINQLDNILNYNIFEKRKEYLVSNLKYLSIEEVLFLVAVYYLELFKSQNLNQPLNHLLVYLEYLQIFNNNPNIAIIVNCLNIILKKIFMQWLHISIPNNLNREQSTLLIEEQCILFFKLAIHRLEIVRATSLQFIILIMKEFPSLYWSTRCLFSLLEILSALYQGLDKGKTTQVIQVEIPNLLDISNTAVPSTSQSSLLTMSQHHRKMLESKKEEVHEKETIYLPEHFTDRSKLLDTFNRFTLSWITKAMAAAPNVTQSGLQYYLIKFQQSDIPSLRHFGYSFAVYLSTPLEHLQMAGGSGFQVSNTVNPTPSTSVGNLSNAKYGFSVLSEDQPSLAQSVSVMSYNCGEANGLRSIFGNDKAEHHIIEKMKEVLESYSNLKKKKETSSKSDIYERMSHIMRLATAFTISEKKLCLGLLQWIVWTPIYMFSKESIEIAIFCWDWIAAARNDEYTIPLMTEISNAWKYTIKKRLGLFTGIEEEEIELATSSAPTVTESEWVDETFPHRMWINFLGERFQASVLSNAFISIYLDLLLNASEDIQLLSKSHITLGTRFRLVSLALQICRIVIDNSYRFSYTGSTSNVNSLVNMAVILQHRTFSILLHWFTLHPTWYDPKSNHLVQEDIKVLQDVKKRLEREQKELNRYQPVATTGSFGSIGENSNGGDLQDDVSSVSGRSRSVAYSVKGSVMNMNPPNMGHSSSMIGLPKLKETQSKPTNISKNDMKTVVYTTTGVESVLEVLILLVTHELDRIVIWSEPQKIDDTLSPIKVLPTKWKSYVNTAWGYSPKLAIKLHIRFPIDFIKDELIKLVRKYPKDAMSISDAVPYLITEQNVRQNVPELKHLLLWAPTTLTNALTFLNAPLVENIYVQQYAIRTLRKYTPEEVVFYLPQLVQCLRHDTNNSLKNYLIDIVQKSVMFTHQLIWTLRTEMVNESELSEEELLEIKPAEFEINEILKPFYLDVIKAFDANQIRLYKEEFHFFDKITKISGLLIPVEKEKRQARLFEEMALIKPTNNLYTPTNVNEKIKDLEVSGCRTLKSAKKVPILIPFYVKKRKEHMDIGEENDEEENAPIVKLPCIFKAGDDCRHDQLALQIISIFKNIFNILHLPLFLFPYRVITTGRGLGIIECIQNAKSRHQIGETLSEGDNLYNYFIRKYGPEHTVAYQKARKNFIQSMAAYSLVSFILSVKDRHNGNIMIHEEGHVIHIDFGFIFDISPGGKFGIEQVVPFKLTTEMLAIMGEEQATIASKKPTSTSNLPTTTANFDYSHPLTSNYDNGTSEMKLHSEPYNLFVDLMIRGYLAIRDHMDSMLNVSQVMVQSGLPCFIQDGKSIDRLKKRLCYGKTEREAIIFIKQKIKDSYQNVFSVLYDVYQEKVEGVNR
ncbi:hypothetical protein ABK040_004779 [Willaertia magna]